jgi:hypothetical protein
MAYLQLLAEVASSGRRHLPLMELSDGVVMQKIAWLVSFFALTVDDPAFWGTGDGLSVAV